MFSNLYLHQSVNLFFYVCLHFSLPTRGESCTFHFTRLFPACVLRSRGCDPKIDFGTSSRRDVAIPRIHVEDRGDRSGERALVKKRLKGWKVIEFMFLFVFFLKHNTACSLWIFKSNSWFFIFIPLLVTIITCLVTLTREHLGLYFNLKKKTFKLDIEMDETPADRPKCSGLLQMNNVQMCHTLSSLWKWKNTLSFLDPLHYQSPSPVVKQCTTQNTTDWHEQRWRMNLTKKKKSLSSWCDR